MSNEIVVFRQALEQARDKLAAVAPTHLKVDRVIRLLLSAMSRNPKLLQCSKESVLTFCMKCSETGLEPIGAGGAWAVPYENRKNGTVEMQFIPDYRGLINAAKHADCIKDAWAEVVREKDDFAYRLGMDPDLTHVPARGDRGELEAAYCILVLPDGAKRFVVMDKGEVEGIKARSRAATSGPWVTDPGEMWKKTVVRRAMKPFAGAAPELDAAIREDNAVTGLQLDPVTMPVAKPGDAKAEGGNAAGEPKARTAVENLISLVEDVGKLTRDDLEAWLMESNTITEMGGLADLTEDQAAAILKVNPKTTLAAIRKSANERKGAKGSKGGEAA